MTGQPIIAGVGMTRFAKFIDRSVRSLTEEAVEAALADAAIPAADVGMVFFANAVSGILTGQEMIRGQVALRHTGLLGIPIVNVENACASASTALHLACMAVASGTVEVALAVGAEKLTHTDKARSFAAIGTAIDLEQLANATAARGGAAPSASVNGNSSAPPGSEGEPPTRSPFMDIYAGAARAYLKRTGGSVEDFALVAVKNHRHGSLNPKAQYRTAVTIDEVLASREIASPLTLMMCAPIGDGAAAVVVCSEDRARRAGAALIRVAASVLVSGRDRGPDETDAVVLAATSAYERAGLGPDDLDVVELHDAAAPAELIVYEELGLCAAGDGPALVRSGATQIGGRVAVNTSGGLLARGHPIGATGCGQIVELVDQLRGRCGDRQVHGARIALAENAGGALGLDPAAAVVTVLTA